MRIFGTALVMLPLCLSSPLALAVEVQGAASDGIAIHDAVIDALKGVKKLKPSDFSLALGNNAARKAWANWSNSVLSSTQEVSKKAHIPVISTTMEASGALAEALGKSYEGDLSGAGGTLLHAGVSKVTVAGSAYVGGKLFAALGATAGLSVPVVGPVVGAVVGGVVGSVGGAVVASLGTDSEAVKNWVTGTVEGFFAKDPAYYRTLAKETREAFLAEQAQQAAIVKGEQAKAQAARDYGYNIPAGSSDNGEVQFAGKLPDFQAPAPAKTEPAVSDPGKGIPLFPSNAKIDITTEITRNALGTETYVLSEGRVSAVFKEEIPVAENYTRGFREGVFQGRIEDNKITGSWNDNYRFEFLDQSGCRGPVFTNMRTDIELVLNIDGSYSGRLLGGNESVRILGCTGGDVSYSNRFNESSYQGRWKLRD